MSDKQKILSTLKASSVVAVIRVDDPGDLVDVSKALYAGGVKFIEITMTVPGALTVIEKAVNSLRNEDVYIGAGTVLDGETARLAILAGASYVVSPAYMADVVNTCKRYGVVVMPGALTPTEIINAWEAGADVVKIFPGDIGGPNYIKAIREPFPQVELLPTKGIDFNTAAAFIKAGAIAVGTGSALVNKTMMANKEYQKITENARRFTNLIRQAKEGNIECSK
ncbi:MAG: hypothetical protein A2Y12_03770 [Planctomycetes bacterium GWF2_42_9]|nr:MAG: hypothetical protein A2Y12_03770 [Planctomycetes bacterium GWF2_42_9]